MFTIRSQDDLYALRDEYSRRVEWGWSGHMEVKFEEGNYSAGFLFSPGLAPPKGPSKIDVTLRGGPSVTMTAPDHLRVRRLTLESIQIKLRHRVSWEIESSIEMRDVVVADGIGYDVDEHGMMLGVLARGRDRSLPARLVTATLTDCWFLRNFGESDMSLLSFDTVPSTRVLWRNIDIRNSGFIGNVGGADIRLRLALNVTIANTIWHSPNERNLLIDSRSSDRITLKRSLLLVTDRGQVARHDSVSPPIDLEADVRVLSEAPAPSPDEPNPGYLAPATVHEVIAADDPRAARLRALTGLVGDPVDRAALRAARDALLKP